ncbi:hypothetical protein P152DRAFT_446002 [Eremomyces bilateralis CBS 781.70]|uniref:DUF7728 domain-containing protein n=1 Tax=Eremomyces bilateralis CBS 781.70 TaxID=1392243 RepID=A0A6G1GDZ3_9PEZI|nr:uncharacterized protein P152DRAFT_446002 [Eremomyces bilateralis CBS 781.70]KAF1816335.1 hypothetical protein P152DRAFT_446002 [Eremomyces bilateralis CBS 781.70]
MSNDRDLNDDSAEDAAKLFDTLLINIKHAGSIEPQTSLDSSDEDDDAESRFLEALLSGPWDWRGTRQSELGALILFEEAPCSLCMTPRSLNHINTFLFFESALLRFQRRDPEEGDASREPNRTMQLESKIPLDSVLEFGWTEGHGLWLDITWKNEGSEEMGQRSSRPVAFLSFRLLLSATTAMISRTVGLSAAAFALAANAFLLPPDVTIEGISSSGSPGALGIVDPYTQLLKVPCPGCQFARMTENGLVWDQGGEQSLLLNISVGSDPTTLEMNSVQFYPPEMSLSLMPAMPAVPHVASSVSIDDIRANPNDYISSPHPITSWSINAISADTVSEDGHELIEIEVQVSSLAGAAVNVPRIEINAIKDPEAQLMIAGIKVADPSKPRECHTHPLICRWRDIVMNKAHAVGNKIGSMCHGGGKGPHGKPPGVDRVFRPGTNMHHGPHSHHDGAGRHHMQHGPHNHHGHKHANRFLHAIKWIVLVLVVPFLVGASAAAATYILLVAIGYGVAAVWNSVRRSRRGAYRSVALEDDEESEVYGKEDEAATENAKLDVNEAGEAPPRYVDAVEKE